MVCADGETFLIRPSSFSQIRSRLVQYLHHKSCLLNNDKIFLVENCVPFFCGFHRNTVDFKQKYRIPR